MKKKVKYVLFGIIVLAIIGVVAVNAMQPLAVDTVVIELSRAEAYFTELGHVRDDRQVRVHSLVGGEIISVNVVEGQLVQEGDVLAIIDSSDILHEIEQLRVNNLAIGAQIANLSAEEAQMRTNQLANRSVLQSELSAIDAREQMARTSDADQQQIREESIRLQNIIIEQSRSDVQNALSDFETARGLLDAGIITRAELDASEQVLENHRTALATNEQRLEIISNELGVVDQSQHFAAQRSSIRAQIGGIDSSLAQLSTEPMRQHFYALIESNNLAIANLERRADNSVITSPVSGRIETLYADTTNILSTAMPVADIRTESDNLIEVLVSTANVSDLSVGDSVDLILTRQSGDVFYYGSIYSIDDRAEAIISILGVEERRVRVLVKPESQGGSLGDSSGDSLGDSFRSGFDVEVRFITYSSENRMVVPRTSVFEEEGESMVYVVRNSTAVAVPVVLGTQLRTEVVVESGLNAGDIVIRNARQDGLSSGVRVAY